VITERRKSEARRPAVNRVCFTLQVKPERLDEYRARHREVWPEMLDALSRAGWQNYSLFLRDDGLLVGYLETAGALEEAIGGMANEPVNARWQAEMAPFFEGDGGPADSMMRELDEIFHLR
jgi:L-rhamnose mutarotase